jgi:hypothetical protein
MIRLMAAARTTLLVTAWLAGGPAMLLAVAGTPLPPEPPTAAQVQAWLHNPLDIAYQAESVRVLAWTIWALITLAILTVLALHLRALRWGRIVAYLPPPAQSLAAAILGTAVVATSTAPLLTPPVAASPTASDLRDLELQHVASHTDTDPRPSVVAVAAIDPSRTTAATATRERAATPRRTRPRQTVSRRVKPGDTLWDIAGHDLGNPQRWRQIYHLNRGHVQANGHALTNPDTIDVGWILTLPPHNARPPAGPPPPAGSAPRATTGHPTAPAPPHAAASPQTRHQNDNTHGVDAPTSQPSGNAAFTATLPSPGRTAGPSTPGAANPIADRGVPAPPAGTPAGIDLPGGWISLGLGAAVLAAAGTAWRRRHRYRPTAITSVDDPDLLPPLAAMTRIRTSVRQARTSIDDDPPAAPTVREYHAANVKPALPPVGPSGSDLAGMTTLPLSTGLGLTGDGALDATRGLLVATLASGSDDDPDVKGRAIIAAATLTSLLGASAVDVGGLDRLSVAACDVDALTRLEEEIIRRSRLTADAHAADTRTLREHDVHAEPLPQLLLITEAPAPAWTNRLATAVKLGHSVDIGAVIIGDWPTGATLRVAADGATGNHDAPRLAMLDTATTNDVLTVLREPHPDPGGDPPPEPAPADAGAHTGLLAGPSDPASPPPVAVRVLGRPAVLDRDGRPSPGIRSKALELLVYLAVNRHGADLRDIMEALFPDATIRRASERLSTVVADLRKHIRRAATTGGEQPLRDRLEPIPNTGSRYHLDPAIVHVDWWTALDHYHVVTGCTDNDQRLAHLTAAIDAADGALAEGVDYDWVDTDREAVRRHRITPIDDVAQELLTMIDAHGWARVISADIQPPATANAPAKQPDKPQPRRDDARRDIGESPNTANNDAQIVDLPTELARMTPANPGAYGRWRNLWAQISERPDTANKLLADDLGISSRTVQRIRAVGAAGLLDLPSPPAGQAI